MQSDRTLRIQVAEKIGADRCSNPTFNRLMSPTLAWLLPLPECPRYIFLFRELLLKRFDSCIRSVSFLLDLVNFLHSNRHKLADHFLDFTTNFILGFRRKSRVVGRTQFFVIFCDGLSKMEVANDLPPEK